MSETCTEMIERLKKQLASERELSDQLAYAMDNVEWMIGTENLGKDDMAYIDTFKEVLSKWKKARSVNARGRDK